MASTSPNARFDGVKSNPGASWLAPNWIAVGAYVLLSIIAVYPIISVEVPPLVDYPNHLARIHILSAWETTPILQNNYSVHWKLAPNLAMDLILVPLSKFVPLYLLGQGFLVATLLLMVVGTVVLSKVVNGKVGLWPALSFLLLYNHAFFWGFLNFLFSATIALLAFSGWIYLRNISNWKRILIFSFLSLLLFFFHLFGVLIYAVLTLGFEMWYSRRSEPSKSRRFTGWYAYFAQFALPTILFLTWASGHDTEGDAITRFGPFAAKLISIVSPVHFGIPLVDFPSILFLGVVAILVCTRRMVGFAPALKLPAFFLALTALAMPNYLSGVWGTDFRIPPILCCVLLAGIRDEKMSPNSRRIILGTALVIFVVRTSVITDRWHNLDEKFQEFRQASEIITPGASILVVQDQRDLPVDVVDLYAMQFWHMGALAIIERDAFYPSLFTGHTMVQASESRKHIDTPNGTPLSRAMLADSAAFRTDRRPLGDRLGIYNRYFWIGWSNTFDYALVVRFGNKENPYPKNLEELLNGSYFDIFKITRP